MIHKIRNVAQVAANAPVIAAPAHQSAAPHLRDARKPASTPSRHP